MDRRIQRILGDAPHMEHAGSDVALTISSGCLRISTLEGSHVVACHDMPNISFASGGDPVSAIWGGCWASVKSKFCYDVGPSFCRTRWTLSPTLPRITSTGGLATCWNAEAA